MADSPFEGHPSFSSRRLSPETFLTVGSLAKIVLSNCLESDSCPNYRRAGISLTISRRILQRIERLLSGLLKSFREIGCTSRSPSLEMDFSSNLQLLPHQQFISAKHERNNGSARRRSRSTDCSSSPWQIPHCTSHKRGSIFSKR
jgi:hypothetical protein